MLPIKRKSGTHEKRSLGKEERKVCSVECMVVASYGDSPVQT